MEATVCLRGKLWLFIMANEVEEISVWLIHRMHDALGVNIRFDINGGKQCLQRESFPVWT